jgi:transcriptional regulator with XRE-family HTH domain
MRPIKAFAPTIGFSAQAWSNYEQGIRTPALSEAIELKRRFGITFDWLYLGDERLMPELLLERLRDVAAEPEFRTPVVLREPKVNVNRRVR